MLNRITNRSRLAALALGAMTLVGAAAATVSPAAAYGGHGGHWGGGHWGGHGGWGWGGSRVYFGAPAYVVRDYRSCYRVWRTVYIPGEGYVRTPMRVCD